MTNISKHWEVIWETTRVPGNGKDSLAILSVRAPGQPFRTVTLPPSVLARTTQAAARVMDQCGAVKSQESLAQAIRKAAANGPNTQVDVLRRAGFVGDRTFVTPTRTFSRGKVATATEFDPDFVARNLALQAVGREHGSLEGWQREVANRCLRSSIGVALIGAALAAPLFRFTSLTEGFLLLACGDTSTGKSLMLRVGMSVQGSARRDQTVPWATARALEEVGSAFNELLTPFDDLSRVPPKHGREVARYLTYQFADGGGRLVADTQLQQGLAFTRFRSIGVLSSERDSQAMAELAGDHRMAGEAARIFDLRTDTPGGVFDRLSPKELHRATTLARELEQALDEHYGVALPHFIKWLFRQNPADTRERINKKVRQFCKRLPAEAGPLQRRAAEKFGVIYAAVVLARRAGVLDWRARTVRKVLWRLFIRSWSPPQKPVTGQELVERLKAALAKPCAILKPSSGAVDPIEFSKPWIALRGVYNGKSRHGLRVRYLDDSFTASERAQLVEQLVSLGWARRLSGKEQWQPRLKVGPRTYKPRLLPVSDELFE